MRYTVDIARVKSIYTQYTLEFEQCHRFAGEFAPRQFMSLPPELSAFWLNSRQSVEAR
jgi:hypothetical protein